MIIADNFRTVFDHRICVGLLDTARDCYIVRLKTCKTNYWELTSHEKECIDQVIWQIKFDANRVNNDGWIITIKTIDSVIVYELIPPIE